jgi:hypothetical protein
MSKRASLVSITQASLETVKPRLEHKPARKVRKFPAHVSVYLDPIVTRRIKTLAIELECKPHDLLLEAVDLMLRKHGQPTIAELIGKTNDDVAT